MTAIHSASASLLAKRQGKEDTVRLLRTQVRGLLQKIDMDAKMKKMAELQLTVVSNPKNRKAIENQVRKMKLKDTVDQQHDQSNVCLCLDKFRFLNSSVLLFNAIHDMPYLIFSDFCDCGDKPLFSALFLSVGG